MADKKKAEFEVGMADFKKLFRICRDERKIQIEPAWRQAYKIIRCQIDDDYPLVTKLSRGLTTANMYTTVARMYGGVFSTQGVIYVKPTEVITPEHATWLTNLLNSYFMRGDFQREFYQILLETRFYGTAIAKIVPWTHRTVRRMRNGGTEEAEKALPRAIYVPNEDFYIDPGAGWAIKSADYLYHAYPSNLGHIKRLNDDLAANGEPGFSEEAMAKLEEAGASAYGGSFTSELDALKRWNRRIDTETEEKFSPIWLIEGWFNCGDNYEIITAAQVGDGDPVELKHEDSNPFWWLDEPPFEVFRSMPLPNEFPGLGPIEPSKGMQYEYDDTQNLMLEVGKQAAAPMWTAIPEAAVNHELLKFSMNGILFLDPEKVPKPFITPSWPQGLALNSMECARRLDSLQGESEVARGERPPEQTLGQTMLRLQEGQGRSTLDLEDCGSALVGIAKKFIALAYQFGDEGAEPEILNLRDPSDYEIEANLTTAALKELRIAQRLDVLDKAGADLDRRERRILLRSIMAESEIKEAEEIFEMEGEAPEIPEEQEAPTSGMPPELAALLEQMPGGPAPAAPGLPPNFDEEAALNASAPMVY